MLEYDTNICKITKLINLGTCDQMIFQFWAIEIDRLHVRRSMLQHKTLCNTNIMCSNQALTHPFNT